MQLYVNVNVNNEYHNIHQNILYFKKYKNEILDYIIYLLYNKYKKRGRSISENIFIKPVTSINCLIIFDRILIREKLYLKK